MNLNAFALLTLLLMGATGVARGQVLLGIDEASLVQFLTERGPYHKGAADGLDYYFFDSNLGRTVYVLDDQNACCSVTMGPADREAFTMLRTKLLADATPFRGDWWVRNTASGAVYIKAPRRFRKRSAIICTQYLELVDKPLPDVLAEGPAD